VSDITTSHWQPGVAPPELVAGLLAHLRAGTTDQLPGEMRLHPSIFIDPDIARAEVDGVFGRVPMIAAHSSELPEPFRYVTKRLPRNEVVLVRLGDQSVRAYVNMCRHRGAQLLTEDSGHCRVFSCPYHGWSYDLEGCLRRITFSESYGREPGDDLNLVSLPVEERHGFIWVVDSPDAAIDMASWLGPQTDAILASYGMADLHCYRTASFDQPANWKILHDAFLDGYHIKFAHPSSAARVIHTNTYVVEDFGRHCRFASPRKSLDAWLDRDPDPDEPMLRHVMMTHFLGPNCTLLQLEDHFEALTFYPISGDPAESRMEMKLLVPRQEESGLDEQAWQSKWEKNWHILEVVLTGEDFPILRSIQRVYASASATPTLLGRNEVLNQIFHREVKRLRSGGPI
jgi:phenylpropionate dioxygenase-like ring-hydroxylating dioxygenase large terminal subunit